ncbi:MupG family TIM beta-alpha barrel fold protein [Lactobacillus jensenii]|uniref:MupG family TIM beta-alpha barrel fold protein n=1 Tax=Lactobacillus jensenii TaxID=109790 RepID=UPI0022AC3BEC|nr:MupG family TIM beta-alpha barrel fold protein [Lactobacillus jensenii]MCZ3724335.1 MupG family TIM beta-alpha barrel fold protein [Lactobacillus jensenii]MCZ3725851.1 MupG family TIM beta-alpha barrel fold protein [Lactobacillus jensenii]MCZ3728889.1 MupG family TIM beta-alpha barrel fold protein [Lactobacillus jensenii]MCZ3730409.1 MupG family TIM beta-alpha barrel fold protein [Lactobacillus jensenii]MCZ3731940.1 MupG family TIM beta-alpha barrel fold protein [Lactobacillus jensenii]
MLGFSINLGEPLTAQTHNYILKMRNVGFKGIFTSLQAPEQDSDQVLKGLTELKKWCHDLGLELVGDISKAGMKKLGLEADLTSLKSWGLTGVRIDAGFDNDEIAKISKEFRVALNASTISEEDVISLRENQADFDHLEAWHNYYPRPNTGLDREWMIERNKWLKSYGFKVMAFAPGDGIKRAPIFESLPTLEEHRNVSSFFASLALFKMGLDYVFIGDCDLSNESFDQFSEYLNKKAILLHLTENNNITEQLVKHSWHQRADLSRDVIRLEEGRSRQLFSQAKLQAGKRSKGIITSDNEQYLRYEGELEIAKKDLPEDKRVNIVGKVADFDLPLLDIIGSNQMILFK